LLCKPVEIVGDDIAITWTLRLQRGRGGYNIENVDVSLKLENAENFVQILDKIPKNEQREKASIEISAELTPIPIRVGITIPIVQEIVVSTQPDVNEIKWKFNQIKFGKGETSATVQGAIKLRFFPDALGRSIYPTMICNATLKQRWKSQNLQVNCGRQNVKGLTPFEEKAQPENERSTASTMAQEQVPYLVYGKIVVTKSVLEQHGGKYHDSLYLLEISNTAPNTVATNCQASLDLHNNPKIKNFVAFWNKNRSDKISIGHPEFLRLFTVSLFYQGNGLVETKLLFDKKYIDGVLEYFSVPYTDSLNQELRVLLQAEHGTHYPPPSEAFTRTIKYITDNAVEE
jgi:hypothetical protein